MKGVESGRLRRRLWAAALPACHGRGRTAPAAAAGHTPPTIGAASGAKWASWCCSELVARSILTYEAWADNLSIWGKLAHETAVHERLLRRPPRRGSPVCAGDRPARVSTGASPKRGRRRVWP